MGGRLLSNYKKLFTLLVRRGCRKDKKSKGRPTAIQATPAKTGSGDDSGLVISTAMEATKCSSTPTRESTGRAPRDSANTIWSYGNCDQECNKINVLIRKPEEANGNCFGC